MILPPEPRSAAISCNPGGAPANACIAIARTDWRRDFLGKLGNDDFGKLLKATLEEKPCSGALSGADG